MFGLTVIQFYNIGILAEFGNNGIIYILESPVIVFIQTF